VLLLGNPPPPRKFQSLLWGEYGYVHGPSGRSKEEAWGTHPSPPLLSKKKEKRTKEEKSAGQVKKAPTPSTQGLDLPMTCPQMCDWGKKPLVLRA